MPSCRMALRLLQAARLHKQNAALCISTSAHRCMHSGRVRTTRWCCMELAHTLRMHMHSGDVKTPRTGDLPNPTLPYAALPGHQFLWFRSALATALPTGRGSRNTPPAIPNPACATAPRCMLCPAILSAVHKLKPNLRTPGCPGGLPQIIEAIHCPPPAGPQILGLVRQREPVQAWRALRSAGGPSASGVQTAAGAERPLVQRARHAATRMPKRDAKHPT